MLTCVGLVRFLAPSPFAPRVHIRWISQTSDAARSDFERRFSLLNGEYREGTTWGYDLGNASMSAVRSLLEHPAVEDTHYIDRRSGAVAADAPRGTTRLRQTGLAWWINSPLFEWFTLLWVSSLIVSGTWLASARRLKGH